MTAQGDIVNTDPIGPSAAQELSYKARCGDEGTDLKNTFDPILSDVWLYMGRSHAFLYYRRCHKARYTPFNGQRFLVAAHECRFHCVHRH